MKTFKLSLFMAFAAMFLMVSHVFAASDYLLEIEGVKGECKGKHIKLTENADGSFTVDNIPPGTYQLVYSAKAGKTGATKRTTGESGEPTVLAFEYEVKAPRDVATGQASGKRMHKPMTIRMELDRKAASSTAVLGQIIVGDLDGDGATDLKGGDPIPDIDASAKGAVKAGYDLKLNKKA